MNFFKEQIENINKILYLSKIDLVKTYKGTRLGWFWAIFNPAFKIFVYYFTLIVGLKSSKIVFGYPYFLWLISGLVPWFFIKDILNLGSECIRKYDYLVTKINFPISIIPTFCTLSKFYLHFFLMFIVFVIFILYKSLTIYVLQLPIYIFLMLIFFYFLCLFLSTLSAISKDFYNFVKTTVFAIFWLSGIIWDVAKMPEFVRYILYLNPVTFIVNGYRNCLIKHIWFFEEPISLLSFLGLTIIVAISGIALYNHIKKDIPDLL